MSITSLRAAVLAGALLPAVAGAATLTLDEAIALAIQRSASVRAANAGLSSSAQSARAAGQLPDPTLHVGIDNLPIEGAERFATTAEPMTMKRIGVSQEWVSADKRAARQAAADAMVSRQSVSAASARAGTRLQTALAYLDVYYADAALQLTEQDEHHAQEELEAARARLASARGSAQDVLAATGARGVAEDESADARQTRAEAAVALQRWTGTPADALAPSALPSSAPPLLLPPVLPPVLGEAAYVDADPTVAAARSEAELARRDAAVTASERHPNWSWQVAYGQRSGRADLVSIGVNIPLPVSPAERQDRQTAARLALADKAEAELDDAMRDASAQYRRLTADQASLSARIERYGASVVVPAHQRTEAALAAYRSNQASLVLLFEARHMELAAQRRLLMLQRDLARIQAQLGYRPLDQGDRP